MVKYLLNTCCGCGSLRTGTIIGGTAAILLSIIGIIVTLAVRVQLRTFVFDTLDPWIVQLIVVINLVMTIILSILMLVGVVKRNWYLMAPWVVLGGILSIGLLVSIIVNAIYFFMEDDTVQGVLWIVLGLISLVIYIYMWYVAFSFFVKLREESERGAYSKDPFRRQRI